MHPKVANREECVLQRLLPLLRIIGRTFSTNVDLALLVSEWFLAEKNSTVCYIVMANPIYLDSCEG